MSLMPSLGSLDIHTSILIFLNITVYFRENIIELNLIELKARQVINLENILIQTDGII